MPKKVDKNHKELVGLFRRRGAVVYDTHALPNFVDLVIVHHGLAALIEIKSEGGKLTKSQEKIQSEAGDAFFVVTNAEEVDNVLLQLLINSEKLEGLDAATLTD